MNKFLLAGILVFGCAAQVNADLRFCEGRWTNGNCGSSEVQAVMQEHRAAPDAAPLAAERRKVALLQSLQLTLERAVPVSKVPLDIEAERGQCMEPSVSVEQCTELVLSKERILRELAANAAQPAANENDPEQERAPTQYITIVNNNGFDDCFGFDCWEPDWNPDWKPPKKLDTTQNWGTPHSIPQMQPDGRAKLQPEGRAKLMLGGR